MKLSKIICAVLLLGSINLNAQFFEGAGNSIVNVGYKVGDFKYFTAGSTYGLADFLSVGLGFEYTTADELHKPFFFDLRLSLHGGYIFDMEKSDVIFGYQTDISGSHGLHAVYQYALTDFFGFYARSNLYFSRGDIINKVVDEQKLTAEFGVMFRMMGVGNYGGF